MIPISDTSASTQKLTLSSNEIHCWMTKPQPFSALKLDESNHGDLEEKYKALLTLEETTKQQRYKFAKDRHNALITRAFVRDLLSKYADIEPENWRFKKGEKGKPELVNAPLPLRFNISHTTNCIICAVTLVDDIGCDVENTTRKNDVLAIAERYFSPREINELFLLPEEQQRDRFFDYWTLKESYIKAWGLGLAIPLKDFSFVIDKVSAAAINDKNKQTINSNIRLNFAKHRVDTAEVWRSWLFYPDKENRIALSIRASSDNQATNYKLRFFESVPLLNFKETEL
ncbi:MAG: 4'-phosphopantetheinyl transferase superfamily protein [Colwellia sp.]